MSFLKRTLALLCLLCVSGKVVGDVEEDSRSTGSCQSFCSKSYPEHTYPVPGDHTSCLRGCRLAQLEAYVADPRKPGRKEPSCNKTCTEAYSNHKQSVYPCQVGCGVPVLEKTDDLPENNVWIFNTLCELLFLDKLVKSMSWNADTTIKKPFIDSTTILVEFGYEGGSNDGATFSGSQYNIIVNDMESGIKYREYHSKSLYSIIADVKISTDSTTDSPTASSNDAKSMFGVSCDNWKSLLDVLIVFGIILLFLALLDHLFLPTKNGMSEKRKPIVPVHDDSENLLKKPLYIQDSNRCAYAPQEGKYVEGTLVVVKQ